MILVAAGIVLTATRVVLGGGAVASFLGGSAFLVVALVLTRLLPPALEWVKKQSEQYQEEAGLLRIQRPISEVDPSIRGVTRL